MGSAGRGLGSKGRTDVTTRQRVRVQAGVPLRPGPEIYPGRVGPRSPVPGPDPPSACLQGPLFVVGRPDFEGVGVTTVDGGRRTPAGSVHPTPEGLEAPFVALGPSADYPPPLSCRACRDFTESHPLRPRTPATGAPWALCATRAVRDDDEEPPCSAPGARTTAPGSAYGDGGRAPGWVVGSGAVDTVSHPPVQPPRRSGT